AVPPAASAPAEITAYLDALVRFLTRSPAGTAYRTLLAAAQHDPAVKALIASRDVLGDSARTVLGRVAVASDEAVARLVGPPFFWIMTGRDPAELDTAALARDLLRDQPGAPNQRDS